MYFCAEDETSIGVRSLTKKIKLSEKRKPIGNYLYENISSGCFVAYCRGASGNRTAMEYFFFQKKKKSWNHKSEKRNVSLTPPPLSIDSNKYIFSDVNLVSADTWQQCIKLYTVQSINDYRYDRTIFHVIHCGASNHPVSSTIAQRRTSEFRGGGRGRLLKK